MLADGNDSPTICSFSWLQWGILAIYMTHWLLLLLSWTLKTTTTTTMSKERKKKRNCKCATQKVACNRSNVSCCHVTVSLCIRRNFLTQLRHWDWNGIWWASFSIIFDGMVKCPYAYVFFFLFLHHISSYQRWQSNHFNLLCEWAFGHTYKHTHTHNAFFYTTS